MWYFLIMLHAFVSSIMVISARNPVHSVLALISVVLNIVFLSLLLEAEFLALIFVAVYLGAVTVLFLFIVMMLNIKAVDFSKEIISSLSIGSFLVFIFLYILYSISSSAVGVDVATANLLLNQNFFDWKSIMFNITNIDVFGSLLYTHFSPFLLIIGIVLLIAMIGAIILTKVNYLSVGVKRNFIDQQVARNFENAVFLVNEKKSN